ncbi:proteoglycan 4 isoform X3 [Eurosta solidaginis]|uniref:proteoglycan 4 isoform X3 n=1 Tax=Eurosta solidaginis TaxID=178769 RepID=UPI003531383E
MIGSFWNLCRACPSMPVDKQLHSEYRSTYRWHEFTGNSRPEVVRRAPAPNPSQFVASLTGPTNEPPLPRRKKCPELAYKSHEFIIGSEYTDTKSGHASANRLARSEERGGTPSRRSKSEGPPVVPNGRAYAIPEEVDGRAKKQAGESNGLLKKTISKLSTEYRFQFVWPNVRRIKGIEAGDATDFPRKSISMGALRANQHQQQQKMHLRQHPQPAMPTVHKKRTTNQKEATLHELEPLVSDAEETKPNEKHVTIVEKVERKTTIRPFSQAFDLERTNHFITRKENYGFEEVKDKSIDGVDNKQHEKEVLLNGTAPPRSQPELELWFKEVVELRKKAGEYKCRGWGIEIDPELYKKQRDLWDQVSKRSSLSALSLASTVHRPITKEEKEQENNKKSIPISKVTKKTRVPGHAHVIDNKDEISALPARFNNIRHHLERTTGPDVEEGVLLPSPTREKLMPAITKRESESQRGSPKKTAASRHGSPQKGSPQKGSPKKVIKTRSQSVGPAEHISPKRQLRSASTAPNSRLTAAGKKTPTVPHCATSTGSGIVVERKPRPSTLSTTFHSRTKSSSVPPPSGRTQTVSAATATTTTTTARATAATKQQQQSNQSNKLTNEFQKSKQLCKNYAATSYGMPLLRKKDKDKTNLISAKVRPKSTGATLTANEKQKKPAKLERPLSATEANLLPTPARSTKVANEKAIGKSTNEMKSKEVTKTAEPTKKQITTEEAEPLKPKTAEAPIKSFDPMTASVFGQLPSVADPINTNVSSQAPTEKKVDVMSASIIDQSSSELAVEPMATSIAGQLSSERSVDPMAFSISAQLPSNKVVDPVVKRVVDQYAGVHPLNARIFAQLPSTKVVDPMTTSNAGQLPSTKIFDPMTESISAELPNTKIVDPMIVSTFAQLPSTKAVDPMTTSIAGHLPGTKTFDPMTASISAQLPSTRIVDPMTTSISAQLTKDKIAADPMIMSVFGELPVTGSGGNDLVKRGVSVGGSGSGGGGGGALSGGVGGIGDHGNGETVRTAEPAISKNLTLTGLTAPYTRDIRKLGDENDAEDGHETAISVSSCSPQPAPEIPDEPIVKSPPEPTRVKSPEQILMRSPDPVNWTVPLDTGKTFTVTQNVKEGENYSRPQSEIKATTPVEKPPPPPQSAPPQLTEQAKMDGKP